MHVLVIDNQTEAVLIDEDLKDRGEKNAVANRDAVGTFLGSGTIHGPVYHGVKVWVGDKYLANPYEVPADAVFVQWTDRSNSRDPSYQYEKVHTVERPLPGGGIGRFLVTIS